MTLDRLSESHANALASRAAPHQAACWSSKDLRRRRRAEPPKGIAALVSWFRREYEAEIPTAMHAAGVWADHSRGGRLVGGSLLGTPAYAEPFRRRLEEDPHRQIDGEVEAPLQSALAALRDERHYAFELLRDLANLAHFQWTALAGKPYFASSGRLLRMMDEPVLRDVLERSLERLWYLFVDREPFAERSP